LGSVRAIGRDDQKRLWIQKRLGYKVLFHTEISPNHGIITCSFPIITLRSRPRHEKSWPLPRRRPKKGRAGRSRPALLYNPIQKRRSFKENANVITDPF